MELKIGSRAIGDGRPCFIIAEAGVNHNGDAARAKRMIDAAREAGADAVKFQAFRAASIVTRRAPKAAYQQAAGGDAESQFAMLEKLELSAEDFKELFDHAGRAGITFLATPFDLESVDLLEQIGVPAYKVGSGDITNLPLLRRIAGKGKPVIFSEGMATDEEIRETLDILSPEGGPGCALLHCVSAYPARAKDMNLRVMARLRETFGVPVGLSDHTAGTAVAIAAAALGACVIEKHFTLDRSLPGPDHPASVEPDELKRLVQGVREAEAALGDGVRRLTETEAAIKNVARRSIVTTVAVPAGTVLTGDMVAMKRPAGGIEPRYLEDILNRKAARDIAADTALAWEDIETERRD